MTNPDIIASIAALFTTLGFLPQAVKTIKSKDTSSISFWMYLLSFIGVIFWLIFGLMVKNYPIIFKNITLIVLCALILIIKTANILKGRDDLQNSKFSQNKLFKKL